MSDAAERKPPRKRAPASATTPPPSARSTTASSAPSDLASSARSTRKAALQKELDWLRADAPVLTTKRARPKMTYTPEDIAAMDAEANESAYELSSSCDSDATSSDGGE